MLEQKINNLIEKVNKLNSIGLKEDSELDFQVTLRNLIGRKADSAHLKSLNGSSFIPNISEIDQQGSYFYFSSHGSQLVLDMDNVREVKKNGSNIYFYFKNKDILSIKNIYPEF